MAQGVTFNLHDNEMDLDYENLGEEDLTQEPLCQLIRMSSLSSSDSPEILEMEVLSESKDSQADHLGHNREGTSKRERDNPLTRNCWSAATLKVISSMPSHTTEQNQNMHISQRVRRSSRRRRHRTSFWGPHSAGPSTQCDTYQAASVEINDDENDNQQVLFELQSLSVGERWRMLRALPLNLTEKTKLRKLAFREFAENSLTNRNVPCCRNPRQDLARIQHRYLLSWFPSFMRSLRLWQFSLKILSGRFGTGVLSYFLFLRTLLLFNILLFLCTGLFLVIPQAIHPPQYNNSSVNPFTGLDLFTGTGILSQSLMFYGYYSSTIIKSCGSAKLAHDVFGQVINQSICQTGEGTLLMSYNISLAYLFTIGIALFITGIILVYCMSTYLGRRFHMYKSEENLAMKVFCSWDFKVSKMTSVQLQSETLSTQLKELVSEAIRGEDKKTLVQRLCRVMVHLLAWAICVAVISLVALAINRLSKHLDVGRRLNHGHGSDVVGDLHRDAYLLVLPAIVSGINMLLPGLLNLVSLMERFNATSVRIYVSVLRNLLLKISVVGVLCYHWLGRIAVESEGDHVKCWESYVGQELYRFLLMDFIFTVLYMFFGEFLWRLFSKRVLKRNRRPEFDIARNVLELIYGQTLTWIGVLFAPLLPAVQIVKLIVLFYMKKSSLMLNFQVSRKPWKATQMTTLFISLLCVPSFLGAAVSVAYTMWTITPSSECGPFRNVTMMIEAGKLWAEELKGDHPVLAGLDWLYTYLVDKPLFLFLAAGVFLTVIYIYAQVVDGLQKAIGLLEKQIENEGKDKQFLITQLQTICEEDDLVVPPSRPQAQ
ncbi:transmembrane channel-like protein 6 [Lampris incognitus]|uniref:transmembrane channel-like protein 6 n=1 Tax=Lampris incognitus TaxID=2546036 RepID=UPI0024B5A777|nr:transmembrane channel-like protein 6 [Lampris incognitus]